MATRLSAIEGRIELPGISAAPLPPDASPIVARYYGGFLLLVRCRWVYAFGAPVVFERKFSVAWCDNEITEAQAKEARALLRQSGYMLELPKHGFAIQWLPKAPE